MRLSTSSWCLLSIFLLSSLFSLPITAGSHSFVRDSLAGDRDSVIRCDFEPVSPFSEYDFMWEVSELRFESHSDISAITLEPLPMDREARRVKKYGRRLRSYYNGWSALVPRYTKLQFAGNMGLLSFGFGWNYGRHSQWETDIFIGFIPKFSTSKFKITSTIKQNYIPWSISLGKGSFSIDPLSCSIYFNSVWGRDFWAKNPGKYPSKYYTFATKIRINVAIGQRFTYHLPLNHRRTFKSITFFYEVGTNDLYMVSTVTNRYLETWDFLSLSFGLKLQIL